MDKTGFVSVIGRPNVGKSTLLNRIIGEKISIISDKPQTTRNSIQLVYSDENSQIVFLDTPGIQKPKNKLGEYMLSVSKESLSDIDLVLYLVEADLKIGKQENEIIDYLKKVKRPIILVINKIDLVDREKLFEVIKMFDDLKMFKEIVPISAANGKNIEELLNTIKENLKEGPRYFPDDYITDRSEKFIVQEIIREKTLLYLREEIPHGINVVVQSMKERESKDLIDIEATIFCEKESHKGIIIGKGGKMLKAIGTAARVDIERFLNARTNLKLWVKVEPNWRENESKVKYFGYK